MEAAGDAAQVAVFGGSVATIFAMQSEFLVDALREQQALGGRQVVVHCYASPGYRQPQQLLALTYALAQGADLDVVVNIDGFNEVALPVANNLRLGVHPLYPMGWPHRVREVPDAVHRRQLGELAYLREERTRRGAAMSASPARISIAVNLAWRLADRRLARRQAELESELADHEVSGDGFLVRGPPWEARSEEETYAYLADLWRESSLQMHRLCTAGGIRYLHVLQPNQYVAGSKPMGRVERRRAVIDTHRYRGPVEKGYPHLIAAGSELQRLGVSFRDLSMVFAEVSEPLYIDSCCHFSWRGNQILASAIAEAIAATP
jgi:hypothetical protein